MNPAVILFTGALLFVTQVSPDPYKPKDAMFKEIVNYGNGTYFTSENSTDWYTARNLCVAENSQLVAFETEEEYNAIMEALSVFLEQRIMLWTDGVDVFRPRDFYWNSSGLSFNETYANWGVGEPNNSEGSEHCVSLAWWLGHKFNDQPCYATASFICEYHP